MERWDLRAPAAKPHNPEVLFSGEAGRAILLDLPGGAELQEHQVHEGAWITVVDGALTLTGPGGETVEVSPGILVHVPVAERSEIRASSDTRLLMLLSPWPGDGHPGAMTIGEKAEVRKRAAERND